MSGLQDQVNQANLLAEQRNTNAQLLQLITGKAGEEGQGGGWNGPECCRCCEPQLCC
jgi:hypothetical protein